MALWLRWCRCAYTFELQVLQEKRSSFPVVWLTKFPSPFVTLTFWGSNPAKVAYEAESARRHCEQWQFATHLGPPTVWTWQAPQRQDAVHPSAPAVRCCEMTPTRFMCAAGLLAVGEENHP